MFIEETLKVIQDDLLHIHNNQKRILEILAVLTNTETAPVGHPDKMPGSIPQRSVPAAVLPVPQQPASAVVKERKPRKTKEETPPAPTYDAVRNAVLSLAEARGHAVAVGVLGKFGARSGKELKLEDYEKVIVACTRAKEGKVGDELA